MNGIHVSPTGQSSEARTPQALIGLTTFGGVERASLLMAGEPNTDVP